MTKPTDTNSNTQPEQDIQPIPETDLNPTEENKITKLTATPDNTPAKDSDSLKTEFRRIRRL